MDKAEIYAPLRAAIASENWYQIAYELLSLYSLYLPYNYSVMLIKPSDGSMRFRLVIGTALDDRKFAVHVGYELEFLKNHSGLMPLIDKEIRDVKYKMENAIWEWKQYQSEPKIMPNYGRPPAGDA